MWTSAQRFESEWWGDCTNTLGEEIKQTEYARLLGLEFTSQRGKLAIKSDVSVVDIGGGPVSMLLKSTSQKRKLVIEPLSFPNWVLDRYENAGVEFIQAKGEDIADLELPMFDEAWMYNCLQHTENPRKIIENIKGITRRLRIFEWVEVPTDAGHIHTLHKSELDYWLGKEGETKLLNTNACHGLAYFNIVDFTHEQV